MSDDPTTIQTRDDLRDDLGGDLEALKTLNERLYEALRVSRAGTFTWDAQSQTFIWSDVCCALHGFEPSENPVSYEQFFTRIPVAERAALEQGVLQSRENKKPWEAIYRVIWPDQSQHWIQARGIWEYDDAGRGLRLFGIGVDADEFKGFEQELAASENRLREAQEASRMWAWEVDVDSGVMTLSPEFSLFLGINEQTMTVSEYAALIDESDRARILSGYADRSEIEPGYTVDVEYQLVPTTRMSSPLLLNTPRPRP